MIYLDNSATTPLSPEVREAMRPYLLGEFGNASSVHELGSHARVALEESRETVARAMNAEPREIIFTSGGTEANNSALKGVLFKQVLSGASWRDLTLVTSRAEHHATLEPAAFAEKLGARVRFVDVDEIGRVRTATVPREIDRMTTLVSLMMVNNETGVINPIRSLAEQVKAISERIVIHTDAVQAFGKIPVDVRSLGVDMLSTSAHKIHGPKGIGALYVRSGVEWEPLVHGGSQERNRRGGTEAVALAVGFAEAIRQCAGRERATSHLRSHLIARLGSIPEVVLNSATDESGIDTIVNFSFTPNVLSRLDADALVIRFDLAGIAISNGSACTSGSQQPSHVLLACGKSVEVASKSIRVSFSRYNTVSEIDRYVEILESIIPR